MRVQEGAGDEKQCGRKWVRVEEEADIKAKMAISGYAFTGPSGAMCGVEAALAFAASLGDKTLPNAQISIWPLH